MPPFINIETDNAINKSYILLHLYFFLIWFLIIGIVFFRLDAIIVNSYWPDQGWLLYLTPIILILFIFFSLNGFKWYFKLAFLFYIPLLFFWFFPKFILQKGKFYLFISYFNTVFSRIRKWKSTILHGIVFITVIILLSNIPSIPVRIFSIMVAGYVLFKYNYRYLINSFKPTGLLGQRTITFLSPKKKEGKKTMFENLERMIKTHEKEGLSTEEVREKQMSQIVTFYTIIDAFKVNLESSKGGLSFVLYWVSTFLFSILMTVFLISFINLQLHLTDSTAFFTEGTLGFWEFVRYTGKCLTYGDIVEIRPMSSLAKLIEGGTFFVVGIIYLIIIISFGYSYKSTKVNEEKQFVVEILDNQLIEVNDFAAQKFGQDYQEIVKEIKDIGESVAKIKEAFRRII